MVTRKTVLFTTILLCLQLMFRQCGADTAAERCSIDCCADCTTKQSLPENLKKALPLTDIIEQNNSKSDGNNNKAEESRWYLCSAQQTKIAPGSRLGVKQMFIIVLGTLLLVGVYHHFENVRRYPPGPTPWPFVGNLLQIDQSYPHRSMVKWQKRYGSVFTVWLPKPTVIVAEWKALQRVLLGAQGEHCLRRPASFVYGLFADHLLDGDGIILSSGETWRTQRRFAVNALRQFGMGGQRMERRINLHKDEMIRRLANDRQCNNGDDHDAWCRRPILVEDIGEQLAFCFGNIIHDLVMGRHYAYNDPEFRLFKYHIDETLKRVASVPMLIIDCYPWTRFFFPQFYRYIRHGSALRNFFLCEIADHARRIDAADAGRQTSSDESDMDRDADNVIDAFLLDIRRQKWNVDAEHNASAPDDTTATEKSHSSLLSQRKLFEKTLALNAGDLWTGGLETVVTTLHWAIIYLIHHPRVQHRLQEEVDCQLGMAAFRMADRSRLPYLRATIDELQRIVNVLPWHIPHAVDQTVELDGRRIPCGATVMPQFGAVHFDDKMFPDAEHFVPERFLQLTTRKRSTGDGKPNEEIDASPSSASDAIVWHYRPNERLAPFGIGKRACLGEGLARMELHVVLAALVQNFHFEAAGEDEVPSVDRLPGMTSKPKPFRCRIWRRRVRPVTTFDDAEFHHLIAEST